MKAQTFKNKKGQLVFGIIGGIASLIILTIVCFLIMDTLNGANLLSTQSGTITNETITTVSGIDRPFSVFSYEGVACTVSAVINATGGEAIASGNYTITNCAIKSKTATYNNTNWKVSYAYTWDGNSQASVDKMIGNYTAGIDNVSAKIPTVLLVAAVVLLFGAIVILVQRSRQTTESSGGGL